MAHRRRLLPLLLLLGWLFVWVPSLAPAGWSQSGSTEIRGVWLTLNDMGTLRHRERMKEAVARLGELHFNTLYPVVWNGGYAYYPSEITRRRQIQSFDFSGLQGQDVLAEIIDEGHARNLTVIPWFEFGFMAPPSSELATRHPEWLTRKQDGGKTSMSAAGEVVWLNPFRPEVQQLITELVMEVITKYDGDGIQFDDHMSLPSEFGYDPYTLDLYRRETGRGTPSDPRDGAWLRWRADKITAFMQKLHDQVKAKKPAAIISVSPNYYDFAYKMQLQDWLVWVDKGIADEIIVQIYRPDLDSFLPQLARPELGRSRQRIPVGIGIMSGQRTRPVPMQLIEAQVQAARQRGLGVAFFYLESLWNTGAEPAEVRQAAFAQLFSRPAPRRRAAAESDQSAG